MTQRSFVTLYNVLHAFQQREEKINLFGCWQYIKDSNVSESIA